MAELSNRIWELVEKTTYALLMVVFKLIGKNVSDETYSAFMQFVKFGIVGLSNTAISYVLYVVGLAVFRWAGVFSDIDYIIASIIAFILSVLWSFYWNNKMVFQLKEGQKRSVWKALIKTYISYSFSGLFLNNILLILWVQFFNISELIAPIINLLISVPINFLMNKFWAFKGYTNENDGI